MNKSVRIFLLLLSNAAILSTGAVAQAPYLYTDTQLKERLPFPVLATHPDWVELYWSCWQKISDTGVCKQGNAANKFVPWYMDENCKGCSNSIFQWDCCFNQMFFRYGFFMFPTIISLDNFYKKQHADGYICRQIRATAGEDGYPGTDLSAANPPLFSWAEWKHYLLTRDKTRITKKITSDYDQSAKSVFDRIVSHFYWLKTNRHRSNGLYYSNGMASGMDNTPRNGYAWICLSAQQALNARYIRAIALEIGDTITAAKFKAEYDTLKDRINTLMWDNAGGIYYDINSDNSFNKVKTPASFWPMVAGLVDSAHAARLFAHARDTSEFWTTHVFPSLSKNDPNFVPGGLYWVGSVWGPLNYMGIKGFKECNRDSFARAATANHLNNVYAAYKKTGDPMWENWSPTIADRGSVSTRGYTWSALGPIALLIEVVIGIEISDLPATVEWNVTELGQHGLRNLRLADDTLSLTCAARAAAAQIPQLTVETKKGVSLKVIFNRKVYFNTFTGPGTFSWKVDETGTQRVVKTSADRAPSFQKECIVQRGKILVTATGRYRIEIINPKGMVVTRIEGNGPDTYHLDRTGLPHGVYFLNFRSGKKNLRMAAAVY